MSASRRRNCVRARVYAYIYTRSVHRAQTETGRTTDGTIVCNANVSGTCSFSQTKRETRDFNLILRIFRKCISFVPKNIVRNCYIPIFERYIFDVISLN